MIKPIFGVIVDKYRVKRVLFLTFVLLCGLTAFALNLVQKIPKETAVDLRCDATTTLNIFNNNNNNSQLSQYDENLITMLEKSSESLETCKVRDLFTNLVKINLYNINLMKSYLIP